MIQIEEKFYSCLLGPLLNVPFNNLFARAVIEQHVSGSVYVDRWPDPNSYYIIHPYGMSLLFGDHRNSEFNSEFYHYIVNHEGKREQVEWMQVYPENWNRTILNLLNEDIKNENRIEGKPRELVEMHTRVNFRFNPESFRNFQINVNSTEDTIPINESIFNLMEGSVVPKRFWNCYDDFLKYGSGYCICESEIPVAAAFASYAHDQMLELGIESKENFRNRGFAQKTCTALIMYCLDRGLEPVWSCLLSNIGSYKLALKLGFEPTLELPYYKLNL